MVVGRDGAKISGGGFVCGAVGRETVVVGRREIGFFCFGVLFGESCLGYLLIVSCSEPFR